MPGSGVPGFGWLCPFLGGHNPRFRSPPRQTIVQRSIDVSFRKRNWFCCGKRRYWRPLHTHTRGLGWSGCLHQKPKRMPIRRRSWTTRSCVCVLSLGFLHYTGRRQSGWPSRRSIAALRCIQPPRDTGVVVMHLHAKALLHSVSLTIHCNPLVFLFCVFYSCFCGSKQSKGCLFF